MTLDEAIEQFKYDAECNRADLDLSYAEDNEQVAEWLKELKELRNMTAGHLYAVAFNMGYLKAEKEARNKAIDDFAEKIIRYVDCGHLCSPTEVRWSDLSVVEMVKKLAEQLKAGDNNGT